MERFGGGISLWERPVQVSPRCGPVGGLGRSMSVGRYYDLRRSGHNPLVSHLHCIN